MKIPRVEEFLTEIQKGWEQARKTMEEA